MTREYEEDTVWQFVDKTVEIVAVIENAIELVGTDWAKARVFSRKCADELWINARLNISPPFDKRAKVER